MTLGGPHGGSHRHPWPGSAHAPGGVTFHATSPDLIRGHLDLGRDRDPGTSRALLELRLGESGHDAMGLAVQVPHYLVQFEYPRSAIALLRALSGAAGLVLPSDALEEAALQAESEIDQQTHESDEFPLCWQRWSRSTTPVWPATPMLRKRAAAHRAGRRPDRRPGRTVSWPRWTAIGPKVARAADLGTLGGQRRKRRPPGDRTAPAPSNRRTSSGVGSDPLIPFECQGARARCTASAMAITASSAASPATAAHWSRRVPRTASACHRPGPPSPRPSDQADRPR